MLRAIITSHICPADQELLTLQLNGSTIGHVNPEASTSRVMSGNREIHLVAGFYESQHNRQERQYIQEQIHLFDLLFADLSTRGLAALPALVEKYFPEAAFLMIASAELVLVWQDRQKGCYLLRDGSFYRLQPTPRPNNLWPDDWMLYGDFYAFVPKEDDLLLFLSPDFVDHFKAEQLEEVFSSQKQLFAMMNALNRLGQTYGYNFDQSWLALQVQRREINRIYKGHAVSNLSEEVRRIARSDYFAKAIHHSRVSRVTQGQELIPAAELPHHSPRKVSREDSRQVEDAAPKPHLGDWQRSRQEASKINLIDEANRQAQAATRAAYEARRDPWDSYLDRVRDFQWEPLRQRLRIKLRQFFNIWPQQPFFSKFFATASIILVILLVALAFKGLAGKREQAQNASREDPAVLTTTVEISQTGLQARAPEETNLEVAIVVKANNLQIRQDKDPTSPLMASVKRGETVTQLAPEADGWVYIRTAEGVEGYAYAEYLLS